MSNPTIHPLLRDLSSEELVPWEGLNILELEQWTQERSGDIFLAENLEAGEVISEVYNKNIHHLVQKNATRLSGDLAMAKSLQMQRPDYFLEKFCFFQPERQIHISFSGNQNKQILRDKVVNFVDEAKSAAVTQSAHSVFEELYMNAIFDAPREAKKDNNQNSSKECEFYLAAGKDSMQISCTDYYGSLDTVKLFSRMHEVYEKGAGEVINLRNSDGGAGIGCVILFENSASLVIGVEPGRRTKVTCLLALGMSNRQREKIKKSLHWFQI